MAKAKTSSFFSTFQHQHRILMHRQFLIRVLVFTLTARLARLMSAVATIQIKNIEITVKPYMSG